MGKGRSPGKWFKNLLLRKKFSTKSHSSKEYDIFSKGVVGRIDVSLPDTSEVSVQISAPVSGVDATKAVLSTGEDEEVHAQAVANSESQENLENPRLTEAAIKVQAACRGYQARRTFQTLKLTIQLQAVIRGHLVRRQAVSAFYCVKGLVKFQAMVRGYLVRRSDIGFEVLNIRKDTQCSNSIQKATSSQAQKLSKSVFVQQLLDSSSSAVPLSLNCNHGETDLAWKWLDCWTRSYFWAPLPEPKKKLDSASDEKIGSCQSVEKGQVKKNTQKSPAVKAYDGSMSGTNKYKQRPKKDSNRPSLSAQEHPQKEIEKSSSKKTRIQNVSDRSEAVNERRKHSSRKVSHSTVTDVIEQGPSASSVILKDLPVSKSKESDPEKSLGQQAQDKFDDDAPHDDPIAAVQTSVINGTGEGIQGVSENLNGGDNCISNHSKRRASLPAIFNDQDNESHSTPRLPSYMAPTESAKAKLRGQGSPRLTSDFADKNSITRRHSLSSSLNGKSGSFSPAAERLVAMSGRGVIKTDRSLSSSRDGTDKLIQPQWRRW